MTNRERLPVARYKSANDMELTEIIKTAGHSDSCWKWEMASWTKFERWIWRSHMKIDSYATVSLSCNQEAESTGHFLYWCLTYAQVIHQILGADLLQLQRVASNLLTKILL